MLRIAILGGTGQLGRGLASRLSDSHEVLVGSRDAGKAEAVALTLGSLTGKRIRGLSNRDAAEASDVGIWALPDLRSGSLAGELARPLEEKLVISPMVPMMVRGGLYEYSPPGDSAAEWLAGMLTKSRVVAALHTIPAAELLNLKKKLDYDVFVAAQDEKLFKEAASVIGGIGGLRPLYVGPLTSAKHIEALTPLLRNISRLNGLKNTSFKVV